MTKSAWLSDYALRLGSNNVRLLPAASGTLAPAHVISITPDNWLATARVNAELGFRFAGLWGDPLPVGFRVYACFEADGNYVVVSTELAADEPGLPSIAAIFPGAVRLERHLHDLLGVELIDCADTRRWTRHEAWSADEYPLRNDFPLAGQPRHRTPSDVDYEFVAIRGKGVYQIPVGPVHAGIIEPGHFRFQAVGEEILRLEERLGYVHKGVEKLAVGRDPAALARLAGRVSGDSTVAHTWAACQAMERAARCGVPRRALYLRAIACERERIANHLGDIGAICNDVGFAFAHVQFARLRELWQRRNDELFGHRLLMDLVVPGGVRVDLDPEQSSRLHSDHEALRHELVPLFDIVDDHPSLDDRLIGTGVLNPEAAQALGCTGYVGKASGQSFDVRAHSTYPPYDELRIEPAAYAEGDVSARIRVRMDELLASLAMLDQLIEQLPDDGYAVALPAADEGAVGLGIIDGWRGEILAFIRFGEHGRIARFFPRDPSWFTWPALERLIHDNIVPDFPVCNKSVNGSYSGQDL